MSNEEQARVLRSALQAVGISSSTEWDDLAPDRQTRHIRTIEALRLSGYCIVAIDDLIYLCDMAALGGADPAELDAYSRIRALIGGE